MGPPHKRARLTCRGVGRGLRGRTEFPGVLNLGSPLPRERGCRKLRHGRRTPLGKRWSADSGPSKIATLRQYCIPELQGLRSARADRRDRARGRCRVVQGHKTLLAALASRMHCRCAKVDTDRSWGRLEKCRNYGRFGDFKHPPTGTAARLIEFSVSGCERGAGEEPKMGVEAHTHMRSTAHIPGGGARDGAARALQCRCRRALHSTVGPVSEEMAL